METPEYIIDLSYSNIFYGWKTKYASLTHWGRVTYICVSNLTTGGSDNGGRQAIIWTNARLLLLIRP